MKNAIGAQLFADRTKRYANQQRTPPQWALAVAVGVLGAPTTWLLAGIIQEMSRIALTFAGALTTGLLGFATAVALRWRHAAVRDGLTGLYNRAVFDITLERFAAAVGRRSARWTFAMIIDVDSLKMINDTKGHLAGDIVIRGVSRRLTNVVRGDDLPARLGGDEFGVCGATDNVSEAHELAERVRRDLSSPMMLLGRMTPISVSVGVAVSAPAETFRPVDLVRKADQAMYLQKTAKREWLDDRVMQATRTARTEVRP